jgi:hypothetical protein
MISGSHGGDYEEFCLLGNQSTFRRNISPPLSRSKNKTSEVLYCLLHIDFLLDISTVNMEAMCSSETSVYIHHIAQRTSPYLLCEVEAMHTSSGLSARNLGHKTKESVSELRRSVLAVVWPCTVALCAATCDAPSCGVGEKGGRRCTAWGYRAGALGIADVSIG